MQTDGLNVTNLKRAIETRDAYTLSSFYADNAVVHIIDCDNPPASRASSRAGGRSSPTTTMSAAAP